jgi:hypothetical protein
MNSSEVVGECRTTSRRLWAVGLYCRLYNCYRPAIAPLRPLDGRWAETHAAWKALVEDAQGWEGSGARDTITS